MFSSFLFVCFFLLFSAAMAPPSVVSESVPYRLPAYVQRYSSFRVLLLNVARIGQRRTVVPSMANTPGQVVNLVRVVEHDHEPAAVEVEPSPRSQRRLIFGRLINSLNPARVEPERAALQYPLLTSDNSTGLEATIQHLPTLDLDEQAALDVFTEEIPVDMLNSECPLCYRLFSLPLDKGQVVRWRGCKSRVLHCFCKVCIYSWIHANPRPTCPLCRALGET
jgi:hypothetical protein